jgi:hypothetical protein
MEATRTRFLMVWMRQICMPMIEQNALDSNGVARLAVRLSWIRRDQSSARILYGGKRRGRE